MKKLLLFLSIFAFTFLIQSQTKRIAHRSHSGSNATFNMMGEDNFGNPLPEGYWLELSKKEDSLRKVDSLKTIGVYPYLFQAGEFARQALKFWGKTILDTTVKKQMGVYDPNLDPSLHKPKKD